MVKFLIPVALLILVVSPLFAQDVVPSPSSCAGTVQSCSASLQADVAVLQSCSGVRRTPVRNVLARTRNVVRNTLAGTRSVVNRVTTLRCGNQSYGLDTN